MQNFVEDGKTVKYVNSTGKDIKSGDLAVVADMVGIANEDIPAGQLRALTVEGVYCLPLKSGDSPADGQRVFWNAAAGAVTVSPSVTIDQVVTAFAPVGVIWHSDIVEDGSVNVKINV
jgi:predicted RecA/RadA family phage recombinase